MSQVVAIQTSELVLIAKAALLFGEVGYQLQAVRLNKIDYPLTELNRNREFLARFSVIAEEVKQRSPVAALDQLGKKEFGGLVGITKSIECASSASMFLLRILHSCLAAPPPTGTNHRVDVSKFH